MTTTVFSLILALTLYGEAGVDSMAGKRHVAGVVFNRCDEYTRNGVPLHQAITAVCLKRGAFSCWNEAFDVDYTTQRWSDCVTVACEIERKGYRSPTQATHYYAGYMRTPPRWARSMRFLGRKDSHLFYVQR